MVVVGFNFLKMGIEKKSSPSGKIEIKNNVAVKDIEEKDFSLGTSKQKGLRFVFEFISNYEPNVAVITLSGEVLVLEDEKKVSEITKGWKKDKKIDNEVMTQVLNTALAKCNVKALILADDLNLPPPVPLPKITPKKA
jgi:hypothetical protein